MGRRKKFDRKKAVTFALQYRSSEDPAYGDGELLSDRIFAMIDPVKSKAHKADPELRDRILSRFSTRDLGIIDEKAARMIKKEKLLKQKEDQENGTFNDLPPEIAKQIKNRDDLWITHLNRMKVEKELQQIEEEEYRDRVEAKKKNQQKNLKANNEEDNGDDEDEEWEDDEEEDGDWEDDGDHEELEDEEFEDEEIEEIDVDEEEMKTLMQEEAPQLVDPSKVKEFLSKAADKKVTRDKQITTEKQIPTKKQIIPDPDEEIDLKNVELAAGVKTKRYDENGLPLDGYNYYQHIADPKKGGAPDFVFVAEYKEKPKLAKDIDLNIDNLTPEQREVLAALDHEEEGAYEELEDDFIQMLTGGESCIVTKEPEKKQTKKKEERTMEISYDKPKSDQPAKQVKFEGELKKIQKVQYAKEEISVQSKKDLVRAFREKVEVMRQKFIETGTIGGKAVKASVQKQKQIEDEDPEEFEELDENDPDLPIQTLTEEGRIDFRQDVAMQQTLNKSSTDDDAELEQENDDKDEVETVASRSFYQGPTPVLNIIKEDEGKKSRRRRRAEANEKESEIKNENKSKGEGEGEENQEQESEEEEEEVQNESVIDKVYVKRKKGETKEEKKARKQVIKEYKNERKMKKTEFKNVFENEKKKNIERVERQAGVSNPTGFSVYKL